MVRLALLIVGLLGMFLLNACSGSARDTTNLDTKDAVYLQTGKFTGTLERVSVAEYDESKQAVVKKEQTPIFNVEDSIIEVDWDSKKVKIETKLVGEVNDLDQDKKSESILLEGQFNDEGIAYLFPTNAKGKEVRALGGLRCKDNMCEKLTIDLGADIKRDGKVAFEQEQMDIKNPSPLKIEIPEATGGSGTEEIYEPESSGARNTGAPTKGKDAKAELEAKKKEEAKRLEAEKKAAELEAAADSDETEEIYEPGVPSNLPSILRPEIRDRPDQAEVRLNDYSESKLFPYNLGDKYPAKAQGFYSFCSKKDSNCKPGTLVKGLDVAIDGVGNLVKRLGFTSADRSDKRYYGSGLLVKNIEEVGKEYAKKFPNETFMIDDLAQKAGGPIYQYDKKGKIKKYKNGKNKMAHVSHQNGLDVDISLPRKNPKNTKNPFNYEYAKAWEIIKSFVKFGYVDVIFLNAKRIEEMCSYLKRSGEKDYQKTFGHLYKESGHTTHMHVRLKCTHHNIGCNIAEYDKPRYGVCK